MDLVKSLKWFSSISLDQLNATMSLMERIDVKYITSLKEFIPLIKHFKQDFYVLSIKWNSCFDYDNVYMDTSDLQFYDQHEFKNPQRTKIRSRHYVDANLTYFEFKQKEWDLTRKMRYKSTSHGDINDENRSFISNIFTSLQWSDPDYQLIPTIKTTYKRITLCSKYSDERVTIDFDIVLYDMTSWRAPIALDDIMIVESKSVSEKCRSQVLMKKFGVAKAQWCSKYCLWLYYHQKVTQRSSFVKTIKVIDTLMKKHHTLRKQQHHHVSKVVVPKLRKIAKHVYQTTWIKIKRLKVPESA